MKILPGVFFRNISIVKGTGTFAIISLCLFITVNVSAAADTDAVIDDCCYTDNAAVQAAWRPMTGSAQAEVTTLDGQQVLRLPNNFAGNPIQRASWDRKVKLDLAPCKGVQFKIFCKNPAPISHFSIYFQSGDGWYSSSFFPESTTNWNTITVDKSGTRSEGKPAGWGQVQTIRISAWRGKDENTEIFLSDIRKTGVLGIDTSIAILRNESAARSRPNEAKSVDQFSENIAQNLQASGINSAILSDLDATTERLQKAKLVILPHNPGTPDNVSDELIKFMNGGGKLLVFYGLPSKLRPVVKIEGGAHIQAKYPGQFSSIRFTDKSLSGAPAMVGQRSWNISEAKPVEGSSRVLAEWLDDKGQPTGYAAIVASSNCMLMTHVLLNDDTFNKQRMLLAMVGSLVPDIWRQTANARIKNIGKIADYKDFDEAITQITKTAKRNRKVRKVIAAAKKLHAEALENCSAEKFPDACDKATEANKRITEAFCMAQKPLKNEFRSFWCHNAFGVEGIEWDEAIKRLADNGFTAILPNMLWGGTGFYDSKVLPVAPEVAEKGDQIAKCVAACKKYGVQIHVWKVNWNLGHRASKEFTERMRQEGRLQANSQGKEEPWLCPSHPDNQKLEVDSMVEVARNYDVDGIHFDYIRYPDNDHCFCAGCRERFAKAAGVTIQNWPKDVLGNGPFRQQWLDWRCNNITAVVKATSEQARAIKPKIKISAAVFSNWATDRDGVGQDWKLWCEKGYLDFVCPMDYTESDRQFDNRIALQKDWAGKTPCYPGIGVSTSSSRLGVPLAIGQINITRKHDTKGFVIFNYGVTESHDLLPMLGLGITSKH
ncbi:MAG: family 10 glycosylhydrolase [Kiritimatiellae bacterium]|nr:family 10 glycosylhydrolase [Kiritimatiellia bacterium]MDD5521650.1 family 10 glycosylhydrolase [Kiritimatiellia bacterium]